MTIMDTIDDLLNDFSIIRELYEREKDNRIKDFLRKLLLETANKIGNYVIKD